MRQIGFKNFRRFANFPSMELAPITIFVGENNAGKSTVVKGILALSDFLNRPQRYSIVDIDSFDSIDEFLEDNRDDRIVKRQKMNQKLLKNIKFNFNTSYLAHIGTFKRALYNRAENNAITLQTKLDNLVISFVIKGNPKDEEAVSGTVTDIIVFLDLINVSLHFNLAEDKATVTFHPNNNFKPTTIDKTKRRENYFSSFNTPVSFEMIISCYWFAFRGDLVFSLIQSVENAVNATLFPLPKVEDNVEEREYISFRRRHLGGSKPIEGLSPETIGFLKSFSSIFHPHNSRSNEEDIEMKYEPFHFPGVNLRPFFNSDVNIEYLYAHAVTQTVIYSAKDTNDYLSRTVHEFASQKEQQYKRDFITKWMKEFGVGNDYEIRSVGGEAHIVYIVNSDGEKVNLADKGMGSIQLMVLLFRLAISLPSKQALRARQGSGYDSMMSNGIIIIEEPEQNLHPMLQSKLADLLYNLYDTYGYRFIIETHSEYLIRKTQVIVKEKFNDKKYPLKDNPFKVYYFNSSDSEKPYYEIIYQKDGSFSNDFGKGFFDEASNLAFEIL